MDDADERSEFEHQRARERVFLWLLGGLAVGGLVLGIVIGMWITR